MAAIELVDTPLFSDASLKAYYRFNTGALTTDSKDSYTLTNNNTVGETSSGQFGYAADLGSSNTNKSLTRASDLGIGTGAISINLWVKCQAEPATDTSFGFASLTTTGSGGNDVDYMVWYTDQGGVKKIRIDRTRVGGSNNGVYKTVTLGTANWHMITLTWDGTTLKGYHNGEYYDQLATSGDGATNLDDDIFLIGAWKYSGSYYVFASAFIDDVSVFSKALSATEISNLYNGTWATGAPWEMLMTGVGR